MPLYEIVKADGTREKVAGLNYAIQPDGELDVFGCPGRVTNHVYEKGTWLEVWRLEGVGE